MMKIIKNAISAVCWEYMIRDQGILPIVRAIKMIKNILEFISQIENVQYKMPLGLLVVQIGPSFKSYFQGLDLSGTLKRHLTTHHPQQTFGRVLGLEGGFYLICRPI